MAETYLRGAEPSISLRQGDKRAGVRPDKRPQLERLGEGYIDEYNTLSAVMFEAFAKLLFQACILGVTQKGAPAHLIGVAIRTTLAFIYIVCINVTGLSVDLTQLIGQTLVGIGGNAEAVAQLWLFMVAPHRPRASRA